MQWRARLLNPVSARIVYFDATVALRVACLLVNEENFVHGIELDIVAALELARRAVERLLESGLSGEITEFRRCNRTASSCSASARDDFGETRSMSGSKWLEQKIK